MITAQGELIYELEAVSYTHLDVYKRQVLYDVLNHIAIDARLAQATDYEVDLAIQHLEKTQEGDLIIADRGYASYGFLAHLHQAGRDFIVRCSSGSFPAAQALFSGQGPASQLVILTAPLTKKKFTAGGLPKQLSVRFVRVVLELSLIYI